jgi:hypothetical protein
MFRTRAKRWLGRNSRPLVQCRRTGPSRHRNFSAPRLYSRAVALPPSQSTRVQDGGRDGDVSTGLSRKPRL